MSNPSGELRGQIDSSADPTAVTMNSLSAINTPGTLLFALLTLAFTGLAAAFLLRRRR